MIPPVCSMFPSPLCIFLFFFCFFVSWEEPVISSTCHHTHLHSISNQALQRVSDSQHMLPVRHFSSVLFFLGPLFPSYHSSGPLHTYLLFWTYLLQDLPLTAFLWTPAITCLLLRTPPSQGIYYLNKFCKPLFVHVLVCIWVSPSSTTEPKQG